MKILLFLIALSSFAMTVFAQTPPIEPGVPLELAKWRAEHYSDVRYELDLTIGKMAPTLKGKMKIEVTVRAKEGDRRQETGDRSAKARRGQSGRDSSLITRDSSLPIVLDWRKISGQERLSRVRNVRLNGKRARYREMNEHLVFRSGVVEGKNRIELEFESPILTSGSAITRYVDKEDDSEYIYSLFVPSDASTAFPVFDQPDMKARFELKMTLPREWKLVTNGNVAMDPLCGVESQPPKLPDTCQLTAEVTKPISTYVFAFAAGPFAEIEEPIGSGNTEKKGLGIEIGGASSLSPQSSALSPVPIRIFLRKSQAEKFKQHSSETFRLNRKAIRYLEDYFDYPFPFPKYDVVLIPEFPFGGMEHAGATFLRETSVIFPTEPTANNYISRGSVIFHEAAHQWFGDTVTMKWFDDLWLKEGFATFMAYKAMEKVLPEYDSWKVFYQRVKPTAYATDVTKGTVPIYQDIPNLSAAKSAYGAIVYQKAPSFLRQAEFFLGEEKFRQAVRDFLKQNEYANAEWSDLVAAFEKASGEDLGKWADVWVKKRSLPVVRLERNDLRLYSEIGKPHDTALVYSLSQEDALGEGGAWPLGVEILMRFKARDDAISTVTIGAGEDDKSGFARFWTHIASNPNFRPDLPIFVYPNYRDYGYGIFLLDPESRKYVLGNIRKEKDGFLRAQMWGSLWDSVRFAELAPLDYINLAIENVSEETDETSISSILGRTSYAYTYYVSEEQRETVAPRLEAFLVDKMYNATTVGKRITYYRALLGVAKGEKARDALKDLFRAGNGRQETGDTSRTEKKGLRTESGPLDKDPEDLSAGTLSPRSSFLSTPSDPPFPIRPKDCFDIATRLIEIDDPDGAKFLAELEKTEKDDAALRWAYAAKAGFPTAENKEKYWKDFTENKEISESWIEEAFGAWNSPAHADLTLPYLQRALAELPKLKRNRKIFFVNGWLGAFIGGQKSRDALDIIHVFLETNPEMDADLRRKILENVDGLERAVRIRAKYGE